MKRLAALAALAALTWLFVAGATATARAEARTAQRRRPIHLVG